MRTFLPGGRADLSHDLLELNLRAGGQPGHLTVAGQTLPVIKLAPNIYATDEKVTPAARVAAAAQGSDIHHVGTPSDFHFFLQRYKRFEEEHGTPAKS